MNVPHDPSLQQPFDLRFANRGDYLHAVVSGDRDSPEISLAYWRAIAAECARRGAHRLLIRDELPGQPNDPEQMVRLAQALRGSGLEKVRVAFHEPVIIHLRLVEHGELAMREAGFTLRVFGSEHEAELWLRYGA